MAHNLATGEKGEYVFASYEIDAWHRLGTVLKTPMTATEAWQAIDHYSVAKIPMYMKLSEDGPFWPSNSFALTRIKNDVPEPKVFGVVSESYTLITPEQFCEAWDIAGANWPIETIGCLGNGEKMFVMSKMPQRSIAGEEYNMNMLAVNSMNGKASNILRLTPIRVVCQNTLNMALKDAESNFAIDHDSEVVQNMVAWIKDVLESAEQRAQVISEALEILSTHKMTEPEEAMAVKVAVPVPNMPKKSGSPLFDQKNIEQWEIRKSLAEARQGAIFELYSGKATGWDSAAMKGTAYGMYNAVTEGMDHVIPSRNADDMASTAVMGWRSQSKADAFKYLLDISKN